MPLRLRNGTTKSKKTSSRSSYVTGTLADGTRQTFTSPEVAKQYGATLDKGQRTSSGVSIQQQQREADLAWQASDTYKQQVSGNNPGGLTYNGQIMSGPLKPAPAVVTSQQARTQTLQNQNQLQNEQNNLAATFQPTQPAAQKTDATFNTAPATQTPQTPAIKQIDDDTAEYMNLLDTRMQGVDAASKALIEQIKQSFSTRKAEMERTNQRSLQGVTTAGLRAGRTRYANEVQSGILSNEERAGISRLAELDAAEKQLIASAQQALADQQFALLDKRMTALASARQEKQTVLQNLHQMAIDNERLAIDQAREYREQDKYEREQQEALIASTREGTILRLIDQGIEDPMELYDYINFDENGNQIGDMTFAEVTAITDAVKKARENPNQFELSGGPGEGLYQIERGPDGKVLSVTALINPDTKDQWELKEVNGKSSWINKKTQEVIPVTDKTDNPAVLEQSKDKVTQIDNLLSNSGLNSVVGPNVMGRWSVWNSVTGKGDNAIADIQQITEQLTLEKLISAKAAGATFGALSEGELRLLAASASKIGTWAIRDKDGKVTGYKASEKDFRAELKKIQDYARQDYIRKGGNPADVGAGFDADAILDQLEGGGSEGANPKDPGVTSQPTSPSGKTPYLNTLGTITGPNGSKYWKWGLDVDLKKGDPVKSPVNGKILAINRGYNGGFGNQVKIQADDGREIWLSHMDKLPTNAKPGTRIKAGQTIAIGGNSGKTYSNGGDGSHVDITMPKPGGGYYTAQEVQKYLENKFV